MSFLAGAPALSPSHLARSELEWTGGATTAATGEVIDVYVSSSLAPELGTPQTWADFLAGRLHGPELSALTARIATLPEVQEICGPRTLGCYGSDELVAIGETTTNGTTAEAVVRHEYGHHIALHRLNAPWQAIDWGPKSWASAQQVCRRLAAGTAFPGDEGIHYRQNPGEAWAETYRVLDEQKAGVTGSAWSTVDASFYPGAPALQAAERDVVAPWAASTTQTFNGRFTQTGPKAWKVTVATPLDGALEVVLRLPRGGLYDLTLLAADGRTLARGLWSGTAKKRIAATVCGQRRLVLRVKPAGALGPFLLRVTRP